MVIGIILAGGSGTRMNFRKPKQFIEFAGIPLIEYSLQAFQNCDRITNILVVCKSGYEDELKRIARVYSIEKLDWIVPGGKTHQQSLTNALDFLHDLPSPESNTVVIHNANRPFVTEELIADSIRVCMEKGNGISALGCVDTIMQSEDGISSDVFLERSEIIRAQSPQAFPLSVIYEVYKRAQDEGLENRYECDLMTHYGHEIYFSKGSERNIKITTPEDVELFYAMVNSEVEKESEKPKDMDTLDRERVQEESRKMMDIVMEICERHNLTCYLAYGTLLGAVRHHGFIPWDDDIDLMIHVDEYRKLEGYLKEELPEEYFLQSIYTDRYYGLNWMKIRKNGTTCVDERWNGVECHGGFALDIFQISYVPDGHIKYLLWKFFYRLHHAIIYSFPMESKPSLIQTERKKLWYHFLLCIPHKFRFFIAKKLDPILFGKRRLHTKRAIAGNVKEIYPAEVFEGKQMVEFEGKLYPAPEKYKEFLTCRYGNYLKLPKPKNRTGHKYVQVNFEEQMFYPKSVSK